MVKAILFAILFAIVGLVVFALLAPVVLKGSDPRTVGRIAFPFIVLICGIAGFVFGKRRSKK
jgi:hypothetical protein